MTCPTSQFDFNQPVAYDAQAKHQFHTNARRQLIALAAALGLDNSDYDLRSNQAGVAVSGEITLHSDRLYIQVSQSVMGSNCGILFRSCDGRRDYVGGVNNFAPLDLLHQPEQLARQIKLASLA